VETDLVATLIFTVDLEVVTNNAHQVWVDQVISVVQHLQGTHKVGTLAITTKVTPHQVLVEHLGTLADTADRTEDQVS
jgi:hypothetical protein